MAKLYNNDDDMGPNYGPRSQRRSPRSPNQDSIDALRFEVRQWGSIYDGPKEAIAHYYNGKPVATPATPSPVIRDNYYVGYEGRRVPIMGHVDATAYSKQSAHCGICSKTYPVMEGHQCKSLEEQVAAVKSLIPTKGGVHIGYKHFSLRPDGVLAGAHSPWYSRTFEAVCKGSTDRCGLHLAKQECQCGVYSWTERPKHYSAGSVLAQVVNYGVVWFFTEGYRSQYSQIEQLWLVEEEPSMGNSKAKAYLLSKKYGVPCSIIPEHTVVNEAEGWVLQQIRQDFVTMRMQAEWERMAKRADLSFTVYPENPQG